MAARSITDELWSHVDRDALYERPIPERHRLIFYVGHLEAFDWNLTRHVVDVPPLDPHFDRLFAFGIDPPPGELPKDIPGDWPPLAAIEDYTARARELLDRLIGEVPDEMVSTAIEHRLMHAETLCYLLHNLPPGQKRAPGSVPSAASAEPPRQEMVPVAAGWATLGRSPDEGFGWDNEFNICTVQVPPFRIQRYKVTNSEFLEFVRAGGPVPHYWREVGGEWMLRTMFGEMPLPLDHPVYVTHAQARGYAVWAGLALPSEAQWHRAAYGTPDGGERPFPWGADAPETSRGNFDFRRWDTAPVASSAGSESAFGVSDLLGNGWEWTDTVFQPFPGFQSRPYYPGYSANFFDGAHFVMKGGSPRTAARLLRRSFRNWFRPDYPYVYAAFRCVDARS
jgi:formylglycine-generating enzyme required for sulfatase activity